MRILVAGGAGFIGSHFVRRLLNDEFPGWRNANVTVLDKLTYAGNLANLALADRDFSFVHGDICNPDLLNSIVPGCDVVVNFAAESHVDRSIADAGGFVQTNVLGVHTLMQACLEAGTELIVQISTDEVYGSIERGSWTESAPLAGNSPYAATKACGDMIALSYWRTHGLPIIITRCGNNYGPYQYPEKIIPLFITNLLDGRKVPLYGDGGNVRQWIHVSDHCRGIQLAAERGRPGEIYHIAGDDELSNRELTGQLLSALGLGWEYVQMVEDRKGHDRRYSLDDSKLRALGYAPATPFGVGLVDTIRWYVANRDWWEPLKGRSHPRASSGRLEE